VTRLNREIELLQHSKTSTSTQLEAERSEVAALERRLAAQEAAAKREKSRWGEEKQEVSDSLHACTMQGSVEYFVYIHCFTRALVCSYLSKLS
jgi:septal ring factor EnvC (AmiA/AmiB activator)